MKKVKTTFEFYTENVTLEKLQGDEEKIKLDPSSSDYVSYPEFLKYFRDLRTITRHNMVIGINFTYGWMPTIFDFRSQDFNKVVKILNQAKEGEIPNEDELRTLKNCFNNSLVGTSKLLHFINPTRFAIWDSRVFHYLTGEKPHSYRLDNYGSYLDYLKFCEYITKLPGFNKIHSSMTKKVGYTMTKYRTLELLMYLSRG